MHGQLVSDELVTIKSLVYSIKIEVIISAGDRQWLLQSCPAKRINDTWVEVNVQLKKNIFSVNFSTRYFI